MTLQELYIDIQTRYHKYGLDRAKDAVGVLDATVQGLNDSISFLERNMRLLSIAATGAATGATVAYNRWSSTMVELSGKAGLTIKQFKELTKEAARINRYTGAGDHETREMMQRAYSLGASRRVAENLAKYAGVLHSTRQALGTDAVEAAMALQGSGLGKAASNLQMTHAASQVGGGNVPDYFEAAKNLSSTAGAAGVKLPDLLAMLTIGSRGGSLSGAAAGIDQFLLAIKREPEKRRGEFYRERTGQDWSNLDDIQQRQGIVALVKHIATNFSSGEIFRLFGEKEAIKTVALLSSAVEDLATNQAAITTAPQRDSIGGFDKDTFEELSRQFARFAEIWKEFWRQYGKPWAQVMKPMMQLFNAMFEGIVRLNELSGGLLAWLPALLTAMLVLRKFLLSIFLFRWLPFFLGQIWTSALGALRDRLIPGARQFFDPETHRERARQDERAGKGWFDSKSFGIGLGSSMAGGIVGWGFFGWIKNLLGGISSQLKIFYGFLRSAQVIAGWIRASTKAIGGDGIVNVFINSLRQSLKAAKGGWLFTALKVITLTLMSPLIMMTAKILTAIYTFFQFMMLYSKLRDWTLPSVENAWMNDAQHRYFKEKGLPGGEPGPGYADRAISDRAIARAERDRLGEVFRARLKELWDKLIEKLTVGTPNFVGIWLNWAIRFWSWVIGFIDRTLAAIGQFFRELWANPMAAIRAVWARSGESTAKADAAMYKWMIDLLGGEVPEDAKALGSITEQAGESNALLPYLTLTKEQAEALGIVGGDYSTLWGSGSVTGLQLPTPTAPLTVQSVNNAPRAVISMGDIHLTIGEADDRFDVAKQVQDVMREEMKYAADRIIQEMDGLSP